MKGAPQYKIDCESVRTVITSNEAPLTTDHFRRRVFEVHAQYGIYGVRGGGEAAENGQSLDVACQTYAGDVQHVTSDEVAVVVAKDDERAKWPKWMVCKRKTELFSNIMKANRYTGTIYSGDGKSEAFAQDESETKNHLGDEGYCADVTVAP